MPLQSPEANLLNDLINKIDSLTQGGNKLIRYTEQDFGQLENYEMRPAVAWPCALIDVEEMQYSDQQNHHEQLAQCIVTIRIGLVKYTDANSITPTNIREKGLQFYETESEVAKALHGWAPTGFGKLLRRAAGTEHREDDIRVRVLKFAISYTDDIGKKSRQAVTRPSGLLGTL
jgi:hypothetical protein